MAQIVLGRVTEHTATQRTHRTAPHRSAAVVVETPKTFSSDITRCDGFVCALLSVRQFTVQSVVCARLREPYPLKPLQFVLPMSTDIAQHVGNDDELFTYPG